jgi:hypothetical protein
VPERSRILTEPQWNSRDVSRKSGKDKWWATFRLFTQDGKELPHAEYPIAIALDEKRPVRNVEAMAQRPNGALTPFLPFPTPQFDENGGLPARSICSLTLLT